MILLKVKAYNHKRSKYLTAHNLREQNHIWLRAIPYVRYVFIIIVREIYENRQMLTTENVFKHN